MDIKNLSLQKILGNDWTYDSDFQYADFTGRAELHKADRIILFRRGEAQDISAVSLQAVGLEDKKLIHTADKLMADIGISLRIGDSRNKIIKKFGTPDLIDCIEEGYYRYYNLDYNYSEDFFITRYHYLLAADLLVCFGMPKEQYQKLTDLEIVNDQQMVSAIMESRTAYKESGGKVCPSKDRLRLVHQIIEARSIEDISSKIVYFSKVEMRHSTIGRIRSEFIKFSNCVFEHVEFNSHFQTGYILVENCKFIHCVFHDTFGGSHLDVSYSLFQNCLFEKISTDRKSEGSCIGFNEFTNCIFKDINWMGSGMYSGFWFPEHWIIRGSDWTFRRNGLFSNVYRGGKMNHIIYHEGGSISDNQFSNMLLEDIEAELIDCTFSENELESMTFWNVTLNGHFFNSQTT